MATSLAQTSASHCKSIDNLFLILVAAVRGGSRQDEQRYSRYTCLVWNSLRHFKTPPPCCTADQLISIVRCYMLHPIRRSHPINAIHTLIAQQCYIRLWHVTGTVRCSVPHPTETLNPIQTIQSMVHCKVTQNIPHFFQDIQLAMNDVDAVFRMLLIFWCNTLPGLRLAEPAISVPVMSSLGPRHRHIHFWNKALPTFQSPGSLLGIPQINVRCLLPLLPHAMGTKHFQNGDPCGSSGTGSRSVSPLRLTSYSVFLPFTHVENVKESDDSEKFIFTNSSVFTHLRANCLEMFYVKQQPRPRCIYARLSQTKCFTTWKFDEYKT